MMRQHHGIPVILQNKLQKSDIKSNDDKPKKPIVANAAQLKVCTKNQTLFGLDDLDKSYISHKSRVIKQ